MADSFEQQHVHTVYESIATDFSRTRHKPWPQVTSFLHSLPDGAIGIDVGCGNGKYISDFLSRPHSGLIVGSDYSLNLCSIAAQRCQVDRDHIKNCLPSSSTRTDDEVTTLSIPEPTPASPSAADVVRSDNLRLPHPSHRFDFAISVAVVHHLSTRERRIDAVKEILRCLKRREKSNSVDSDTSANAGKALFVVWALEQKGSRRGWDDGEDQDVMVPWILQKRMPKRSNRSNTSSATQPAGRYPSSGPESLREIPGDGPQPTVSLSPSGASARQDLEGLTHADGVCVDPKTETGPEVFQRYYHLYARGELEQDIQSAGGHVLESGYSKDNWWAIASSSPTING